ncbi:class I SAM-dependent methyltransferase [Paracoccus gahaiensis]|uniref:Class I SAM-dependent methyltransferase n=1 Tax=Paracoccus gahaiensis TaxID=1706839 RepID=A0A4U0RGT6_9RHOB|nr:SAM-dependent methyltransferase [Paracoccus gahaiensis]TJZ93900.1 class I SAM-dependent methyltransferase [Paracoccus gahaiensis]
MTPLAGIIAARIRATGPMSLAEYMRLCLMDSRHGYYATRDPFGAAGDFTTAPEIHQLFGEMCGLALAQAWLDQGRPAPFTLAEPGPGRGTLMADMLRAIRVVPGMAEAAQMALIEASPHLRQVQRERLGDVRHLDGIEDLPDNPLFLIGNEFIDALPIRQFQMTPEGWRERMVGLSDTGLRMGLGPVVPLNRPGQPGDIVEDCPEGAAFAEALARRIAAQGGAAILIDYGGWNGYGDSFQALRNHAPEDPLARPGEADLTAHVDFAALAAAGLRGGAVVSRPVRQGDWLAALGAPARAARLAQAGDAGALQALRRLTDPSEMGHLFKAIAFWPAGAPPVPGFEALEAHADDA